MLAQFWTIELAWFSEIAEAGRDKKIASKMPTMVGSTIYLFIVLIIARKHKKWGRNIATPMSERMDYLELFALTAKVPSEESSVVLPNS